MRLLSYSLRRLGYMLVVLFGLSIVIFFMSRVIPGDPARMAVGDRASERVVNEIRAQMHLDKPLVVQYGYWLADAVRGRFGMSLVTRRDVVSDIQHSFPATFELVLYASLIMGLGGVALGVVSARYKDSWIDNVTRVFAYLGVVTPTFVFGIIFLLLFGFWLRWFPTVGRLSETIAPPPTITGLLTIDALLTGNLVALRDALKHLLLPATALAMPSMAQQARITRASVSANLHKDYITAARALGIPERVILWRFLLKPSLIPSVSILGLSFAVSMGNSFLLELLFSWPGLARYGMNAMLNKDLNAIVAVVLVLGVVFVLANIIVDYVVQFLDPRIRLSAQREE